MPSFEQDLERLGDTIERIIDNAVSSSDYQKLNQTVRSAVENAASAGGDAIRRAVNDTVDRVSPKVTVEGKPASRSAYAGSRPGYQPNKNVYSSRIRYSNVPDREQEQPRVPALYRPAGGKIAGSIVSVTGGSLMALPGLSGTALALLYGSLLPGLVSVGFLGVGTWLMVRGIRGLGMAGRYRKYVQALGQKTYAELSRLARYVGKPEKFVRRDIKRLIDQGYFLEGHMDAEETSLITSDETYTHYLEARKREALEKREEVSRSVQQQKQEEEKKLSREVQEVLDKGNAFVRQIRSCNDAIPGEEISAKISRMETIVQKIFDRAESHPDVVPKLKKLMDYYLPMTVKLLNAYAEMDAQPIQGENIRRSKKEIEDTLDTLNDAFEKLLDSVFEEVAMDLSSDITVLQKLLAQEGLTDDGFPGLR